MAWTLLYTVVLDNAISHGQIERWDTGAVIPGTDGIVPGPGVQLDHRNLEFAVLSNSDLARSRLDSSNLSNAHIFHTNLMNANLTEAVLTRADLWNADLKDADLTNAVVTGAWFDVTTSLGFTKEQLYSTASYQAKNLNGIGLSHNDLTGWDFSGQDLNHARFDYATLTNADLTEADLTGTSFGFAIFTNADLTGAVVAGAGFASTTHQGFTKEQLYSTASYAAKDLRGIYFGDALDAWYPGPGNDLTGWDFSGQNLTGATFNSATLANADLTGAIITESIFWNVTQRGFTKEQLYSTASYQAKDLQGISLLGNNMTGWDFSGQNLTNANLQGTTLTDANLAGAVVTGAIFWGTITRGFTKEQLYSTASYQAKDLRGVQFSGDFYLDRPTDLTDWDLSGQDLAEAAFYYATLTNTNLAGANLVNARFNRVQLPNADLTGADTRGAQGLDLAGAVSRNAILPDGRIAGLDLEVGDITLVRDDDGVAEPARWSTPRPPIPVTIHDHLNMADGSVLQLLFDADQWDSLISFEPGIPVQLGGALELTFSDNVHLATQVGRTLRIFNWTGVTPSGQFEIRSPYLWDVTNLYTTGEVTLIAVPEPSAGSLLLAGVLTIATSMRLTFFRLRNGRDTK
jgi:uncharacterized protein YjbI with pentapeptide repeats